MSRMAKFKHVLVISFPAQGHVIPLLQLSRCIADYGVNVTFVNTESIHAQVIAANQGLDKGTSQIRFVAIPDGVERDEERKDLSKLTESMSRVMSVHLQELLEKAKQQSKDDQDKQIGFMIVDLTMGWALEVAERMGVERAGFWAGSVSTLALNLHIPKLIESGVIDNDGTVLKNDFVTILQDFPSFESNHLPWICHDAMKQKIFFRCALSILHHSKFTNLFLCNSFHELEASALGVIDGALPIGPLIASTQLFNRRGSLWNEDPTCLNWLDQHPTQSAIYVAFGSWAVLRPEQFYELAQGLEQIARPFLWVVRPDHTNGPVTVLGRVRNYGKVVGWAPQEEVLAHPSVAGFFTHCGWNSTLEALSNGVPLLCKPYSVDQYLNRSFICDVWKVGLGVEGHESGLTTRHEVREKVLAVLGSDEIRANCLRVKEMARKSISEGGSSLKNLQSFIELVKA